MKYLFLILLCLLNNSISAKTINIFLKFEDPALVKAISGFNTYLDDKGFLSKYKIEPFAKKYPLHITLYLASFPDGKLDLLKVKGIASMTAEHWHPITIDTRSIFLTAGNYLMLDVSNPQKKSGMNSDLQQISDELALNASKYRDFQAKIPDWADKIPEKKKAFLLYGSPNVFFEYSPHFSLMAKNFDDVQEEANFRQDLNDLIKNYFFPPMRIKSATLGLGYVNEFGQITEEIANYALTDSD